MIQKTVTIVNRAGLHVRPASTIVKTAGKFEADFFISHEGYRINGKSIVGVMTLIAPQGAELLLEFDGKDEEKMCQEISSLIEGGFGEL